MKKLLGAAALLAALATLAVTAAAAETGGTDRPFTGTLAGVAWAVPGSSCLPLAPVRTYSEASGVASHLGRVGMTSDHCPTDTGLTGGHMTFVAADGDELHMTYEGTSDPPGVPTPGAVVTVTVDVVIDGGTGRFANATGAADMTGLVTFTGLATPWPATWTWTGTVSY